MASIIHSPQKQLGAPHDHIISERDWTVQCLIACLNTFGVQDDDVASRAAAGVVAATSIVAWCSARLKVPWSPRSEGWMAHDGSWVKQLGGSVGFQCSNSLPMIGISKLIWVAPIYATFLFSNKI